MVYKILQTLAPKFPKQYRAAVGREPFVIKADCINLQVEKGARGGASDNFLGRTHDTTASLR